jgi:hypothetical protein
MRSVVVAILTAAALAAALPAAAQTSGGARIGFRVYGIVEGESMMAEKSFKTILDTGEASIKLVGGGGEVTNLWKGLFARVAFTSSSNKGSRVFVDSGGTAHKLNIPMTIEIMPVEIGAGWRFGSKRRPSGAFTVTPFAGGGILKQSYKETSTFSSPEEDADVVDTGQMVFGGVEIGIRFVKIGLEAQHRHLPDTLGTAGVSKAFGENNLGGTVLRLTFGVGF